MHACMRVREDDRESSSPCVRRWETRDKISSSPLHVHKSLYLPLTCTREHEREKSEGGGGEEEKVKKIEDTPRARGIEGKEDGDDKEREEEERKHMTGS